MSTANAVAKRDTADLKVIAPAPVSITERRDEIAEKAILQGNLYDLSSAERVNHYLAVCQSLGLNPFTKPFDYLELDGPKGDKVLTLYAKRDAAEQLRKMHGVSIKIVKRQTVESLHIVTAQATDATGRTDEAIGAVPIGKEGGEWKKNQNGKSYFERDGSFVPLAPNDLANALMKAETKAKRRVTLSICGLGFMDESEIETVKSARRVSVNPDSGEIIEAEQAAEPSPAELAARAMAGLHAMADDRDVDHTLLHELSMNTYGVESLTECTTTQLNGMARVLSDSTNDQFADLMNLAAVIATEDDKVRLESIAAEIASGDLPEMAKRLLAATSKRVGESLA
jgi:hypothetical protein